MRHGFSLIELMVVIAIIALLAAVAVPSYTEYVTKSRTAEINTLIGLYLDQWQEAYDLEGDNPASVTDPTPYIANVTFNVSDPANAVSVFTDTDNDLPTELQDVGFLYSATIQKGGIEWSCTYESGTATENAIREAHFEECSPQ